ncbi:DUF2892 domain-containing protein [Flavobacterium sp. RHBU_3]|uniref:DUF2892 domain-containing protein n=1 Tax=Flavobacterium sp. RHBU_3 TaxID=3391184 RepID=UPI003984C6E4
MFNKNIKLVIAGLILATAVWQFTENNIGNGIFLILIAALVVVTYFRNEVIIMAFFKLRKQDLDGADKILDKIKDPHGALVRKQEGYYNYLKGIITSQTNLNTAEKYLRKAIELGLNMDQDLAMAKLQLAGISFTKNKKIEAEKLLADAKKLDKQGMLKDQIAMMKANMKKAPAQQMRRY